MTFDAPPASFNGHDAGQSAAGVALPRQALAIYENTLRPAGDEAKFVQQRLGGSGR